MSLLKDSTRLVSFGARAQHGRDIWRLENKMAAMSIARAEGMSGVVACCQFS